MVNLSGAFITIFLATSSIVAQTIGPPSPTIYLSHSATRRWPLSTATGFAPGSLFDINVRTLYEPTGPLKPDEPVAFQFRAPEASAAQDLTIVSSANGPYQFTALVPAGTPLGQATVLAVAGSGVIFSATAWIAASDFGIFTQARSGYDAAAAQVWQGAPSAIGLTNPAHAGDWITIWGTGLGSASPSEISVEVAGISVSPAYASSAPGLPGVDQINFQFPQGVPDDCYLPIAVRAAGIAGNTVSIAAATAPGPCHHRLGLSSDDLATLDRGEAVLLSQSLAQSNVFPTPLNPGFYIRDDTVGLDFFKQDALTVQAITGLLSFPRLGCYLDYLTAGALAVDPFPATSFDAGTPVAVGPGGIRLTIGGTPSTSSYSLNAIPPSPFTPGDWFVEVPGGRDIAAFQAALRLPPPLHWTNRAAVPPISRTRDLILTWDPTGYTDREWIQGSILFPGSAAICNVPATAGSVTIPASLIAQLPLPSNASTVTAAVELLLFPSDDFPSLYSVPLVAGGSFRGIATFSYQESVWGQLQF